MAFHMKALVKALVDESRVMRYVSLRNAIKKEGKRDKLYVDQVYFMWCDNSPCAHCLFTPMR